MSNLIQKINTFFFNPDKRFRFLNNNLGFYHHVQDDKFLKKMYRIRFGKELNLENPQTFNEKIQWLKLYNRKSEYTMMVDKYAVKEYVASIIGKEHIIPLLGVWNHFDEIDFDQLPDQFVLKCTHDSQSAVICTDKSKFDMNAANKKINKCQKRNYFYCGREWPYKNVTRRIIAEKYMVDESGYELKDYKFLCFGGEPKVMYIVSNLHTPGEATEDFYDMDFKHMNLVHAFPNAAKGIRCPQTFEIMKKLARVLSKGIPQVRVDFFEINKQVYFGEFTFSDWGGMVPFQTEEWDYKFGEWITLPEKHMW